MTSGTKKDIVTVVVDDEEDEAKKLNFGKYLKGGYKSLLDEYEIRKIHFLINDCKINNWRNWLTFVRDIALGIALTFALIKNAIFDGGIGKIIDLLTTDNGHMSQFALASLLVGVASVIAYSKTHKKCKKDNDSDSNKDNI